jgi:hypothetical protein
MDVHNASSTLTPEAFAAFAKPPRRVILQPGEQLYRYASIVSRTFAGNDTFGSPWWIPEATYRQISQTAHRTGRSRVDVARSRLAIATPWNPRMDWLMVIELRKAVQAWIGPARPQPHDARDRSVLFLGNYDQAYVPALAPPDSLSSEAAMLTYYGSGAA